MARRPGIALPGAEGPSVGLGRRTQPGLGIGPEALQISALAGIRPQQVATPLDPHLRPDPEAAPTKSFAVKGIPGDQTDLASRANLIFTGRGQEDLVIEAPVYWTIATTDATAVNEEGTITVTGLAKNPSDQIKKLTVEIEADSYKVRKIVMDLGGTQATIELTSKDLGGKWGVASSVLTTAQFKRVMNYEYVQIGEIWLPSKISVDYQGLDGTELEPTYIYEFAEWQVDREAPEPTAVESEPQAAEETQS